jgi:hypothetical protein
VRALTRRAARQVVPLRPQPYIVRGYAYTGARVHRTRPSMWCPKLRLGWLLWPPRVPCSIRGGVGWKGAAAALIWRQAARAPKAFESAGTSSRRDARRCQATGSARQVAAGLPPGPDPARGRAGGGRRVIRCEVSLDGETWRRAEIERHETPTPANKTWCWVFWSIPVTAVELLRAPQLRVRAVDSSQNMMPEKCAPRPARGVRFSAAA